MKKTREQYDDRVIEARWDFGQQAWRFMRIRGDKPDANHISVVENVIKTILEPVEQKDVCVTLWFPLIASLPAPYLLYRVPTYETLTNIVFCSSSTEGRSSGHAGKRVRRPLVHRTHCLPNFILTRIIHNSRGTRLHLTATPLRGCPSLGRRIIKGAAWALGSRRSLDLRSWRGGSVSCSLRRLMHGGGSQL